MDASTGSNRSGSLNSLGAGFLDSLPEHLSRPLLQSAVSKTYTVDAVIFREGFDCDSIFVLRSGRVALQMKVPGRAPVRILTLATGDLLGWSSLFGQSPMTATAIAIEPTELLCFSASALEELCNQSHELGYWLYRQMAVDLAQRLVSTRLQLLDLFEQDATVHGDRAPGRRT